MELVTVTPSMANNYLSRNESNRKLNLIHVHRLASDMAAGRWGVNGESIKFDTNGRLIDGQHRCAACVMADVSFETYVVEGLAPDMRLNIDLGRPRSTADHLTLLGIAHATSKAATASGVYRYRNYPDQAWGGGQNTASKTHLTEIVAANDDLYELSYMQGKQARQLQLHDGAVRIVCVLAHEDGFGQEWDDFIDSTIVGAGLILGDSRLALRNSAGRIGLHNQWHQQRSVGLTIKAFNWYLSKINGIDVPPMKMLRFSKSELPLPKIGIGL